MFESPNDAFIKFTFTGLQALFIFIYFDTRDVGRALNLSLKRYIFAGLCAIWAISPFEEREGTFHRLVKGECVNIFMMHSNGLNLYRCLTTMFNILFIAGSSWSKQ